MATAATAKRKCQRLPDVLVVRSHREPLGGQPGRREGEGCVLGGERVEEDEEDRQMQVQAAPPVADGGRGPEVRARFTVPRTPRACGRR